MLIAYYFTLSLYLLFSLIPEYRAWGFNWWAYYPTWLKMALFAIGAGIPPVALKYLRRKTGSVHEDTDDGNRFRFVAGAVSLVFVALFVLLRARTHFLGDGYLYLSLLAKQQVIGRSWAVVADQVHALVFGLVSGSPDQKALFTYQFISWVSGVATVVVFGLLARYLTNGRWRRVLIFLSLATGGYALLFFGYVENYPPFTFTVALYLLIALLIVQKRIAVYWILVPLVLAFLSHIFAVALIVPTVYLLLHRSPLARLYVQVAARPRMALFALVVMVGLVSIVLMYMNVLFIRFSLVPIVANEVTIDGYTFFSVAHLLDIVNLLFVLAPGLLVAGAALSGTRPLSSTDLYTRLVLLTAGASFLIAVIFNPNLGMPRDWDLFAFAGLPLLVLLTRLLLARRDSQSLVALSLMVTLGALVLFPRAAAMAIPESAIAHFRVYAELDPLKNRSGRFCLFRYFETVGDTAATRMEDEAFSRDYPDKALLIDAEAALKEGKASEAFALSSEAITFNPRSFSGYLSCSKASLMLGDAVAAEQYARVANGLNPNNTAALQLLGLSLYAQGEFERSLEWYREAREIYDSAGMVTAGIVKIALAGGRPDEVTSEMNRLIGIPGAPATAFAELAEQCLATKNALSARIMWDQAVSRGLDSAVVAAMTTRHPELIQ